ncbi:MAG: acyltransferase, partial [Clostridia bacterium]|nr:acyltransferase [Clostridia bacterium]
SWLLYPQNRQILSPKSNVYRFMERFDVFESKISPEGKDLWRLFDTDEKHPDRLPTDTSMRRAYVEHLKRGGLMGQGKGIYLLTD